MTAPEQLFWAEVRSSGSTQRSIAVCYALLIAYAAGRFRAGNPVDADFWRPINSAINERFGWSLPRDINKVDRLRRIAWDINGNACDVVPSMTADPA